MGHSRADPNGGRQEPAPASPTLTMTEEVVAMGARRRGGVRVTRGLWVLLRLVCGISRAAGAPGDFDATVGSGGVVITDVAAGESAAALVRLPDRPLVVAGTSYGSETT
jgi:hypothetical protein